MGMRLLAFTGVSLIFLLISTAQADQLSGKSPAKDPIYQPKHYPFDGGEKALYHASWNGIVSMATAEIYTTPQWIDGKKFYNVRVEART
jgi:hypothetical protein